MSRTAAPEGEVTIPHPFREEGQGPLSVFVEQALPPEPLAGLLKGQLERADAHRLDVVRRELVLAPGS